MAKNGKVDADCGAFHYGIVKEPPAKPAGVPYDFQVRQCHNRNQFGKHRDIHEDDVYDQSEWICDKFAWTLLSKDDTSNYVHYRVKTNLLLEFNIYWKHGCVLEDGTKKVDLSNPLRQRSLYPSTCRDILSMNYRECNNGGVGGTYQVGCLIYEFKPGR